MRFFDLFIRSTSDNSTRWNGTKKKHDIERNERNESHCTKYKIITFQAIYNPVKKKDCTFQCTHKTEKRNMYKYVWKSEEKCASVCRTCVHILSGIVQTTPKERKRKTNAPFLSGSCSSIKISSVSWLFIMTDFIFVPTECLK